MAEAAETSMSMNNFNLFPNDNVSKDWEEGEDRGECRGAVDDQEWDMVDFEAIREVSYASSSFVRVGNDNDLVSSIDELCGELVDVALDSSWLWEEEVADHGNVVRHIGMMTSQLEPFVRVWEASSLCFGAL